MLIKSAVFQVSNSKVMDCPKEFIPEYAFIGRSNVGKSSLINMLTGQKKLAKTSSTPGKTRLINHFKINNHWFLVDLPGYGYAKVSKSERKMFQGFIKDYFLKRKQLLCCFLLIDCRHEPQKIDLDFMEFLALKQVPFFIIFTKADKLKIRVLEKNIQIYKRKMKEIGWETTPHFFVSSAVKSKGKEEILKCIEQINKNFCQYQDNKKFV